MTDRPTRRPHRLLCALACLALPAACGLLALELTNPPTASGAAYVVGLALLCAWCVTRSARSKWVRGLPVFGALLVASTALVRLLAASEGASTAMITLPDEHASPTQAAPAVDRLVNEADISLGAARLLVAAGALPRRDSRTLIEAARDGYSRMAAAEGQMPSPWFSSVVLGDGADASDVMVVDPAEGDPSESAVIFLHGFGGNLGLPCWQFAQAVADAGGMTVCPSIGTQGDWWTPRGQRIVEQTIAYLRQRGQKKIFLAGLSNGAAGASVLAPRLRRDLAGLVLISGASRRAGPAHVPALIVHGRSDSMMPPSLVRAYVHRAGRDAQYVEVDGGHFVLLDHADEVRRAVAAWLRREMDRGR